MKEPLLIHCQGEPIPRWWTYDVLPGICGMPIQKLQEGGTTWHLCGYPSDFAATKADEAFMERYFTTMRERGFDFERYEPKLCEACMAHEDLPLLVLACTAEADRW